MQGSAILDSIIFFRNTGDTQQAANIPVDLMHSVAIGSLPQSTTPHKTRQASNTETGNEVREERSLGTSESTGGGR